MDLSVLETNNTKDFIFFIPDLFKASEESKTEKVNPDDPFLTERDIDLHCQSLMKPGCIGPHVGVDTVQTLGPKFFERSIKLHSEWQQKVLAEEAAAARAKEEEMKKEVVVKKQHDEKFKKLINTNKAVFIKRSCPVKIPYKSQLTHEEHELYLSASLKFQSRPPRTLLEKQEYNNYMCLQSRVLEEQKALLEFSQQVALKRLDDYNAVKPVIEEYIQRYLKVGYARVLKYPRLYHTEQEIPLRPQDPHKIFSSLNFEHLGHLLSLGVVPWVKLPYPHTRVKLSTDPDFLAKHPPESLNFGKGVQDSTRYLVKTTVSEDPNCEYLAAQHRANIVITPSALKVLVDNPAPNFDKEFDIPVIIRSLPVQEKDESTTQHRVVFIDKPIKRKLWTPLEKKALFFKKSGLATMTSYRREQIFKMKAPSVFHRGNKNLAKNHDYDSTFVDSYEPSAASEDVEQSVLPISDAYMDDPFGPVSQDDEVDVFSENSRGSSSVKPLKNGELFKSQQSEKKIKRDECHPNESTAINKSEKKASLVNENKVEKSPSPEEKKKNTDEGPSNAPKSLFRHRKIENTYNENSWKDRKTPWDKRLKTDWSGHKKVRTPPPATSNNYHYHLFKLHCTAAPNPGLPAPAPITIVVRNHLHGISMEHFNKVDKSFKSSSYVIFPKLENQLFFGCEVNSHSEIVHQWVQLLARPNSELLQVRVCSETGEVAQAEKRDLGEVLREGALPHIKFQPGPLITSLYVTLDALRRKPPGKYLLHHHNRSEAFIHLFKEAEGDSLLTGHQLVFDLHRSYGYSDAQHEPDSSSEREAQQFVMDSRQFVSPPWLAIDTLMPTSFHIAHRKIPATFPMANPDKKMTNKKRKLINARAKNKKCLFDSPVKPTKSNEEEDQFGDEF